jgi:integrase
MEPHCRGPLKPASVAHAHRLLSAFSAWAVSERLIGENPMQRVPKPSVPDPGIRGYTDDELRRLIEAARRSQHPERDVCPIILLGDSGLRASEACGLRVGDVNLQSGLLHVRHAKGGKERVSALGKAGCQAVWKHIRAARREADDWLFVSACGGPMNRDSLAKLLRRLGREAGVDRAGVHRLRHDAACRLLRNGANAFRVQARLGHSSIRVTERYVHIAQVDLQAAHRNASPWDNLQRGGGKR